MRIIRRHNGVSDKPSLDNFIGLSSSNAFGGTRNDGTTAHNLCDDRVSRSMCYRLFTRTNEPIEYSPLTIVMKHTTAIVLDLDDASESVPFSVPS